MKRLKKCLILIVFFALISCDKNTIDEIENVENDALEVNNNLDSINNPDNENDSIGDVNNDLDSINDNLNDENDSVQSISNYPKTEIVDFKYIPTSELFDCMFDNDIELKKEKFRVSDLDELKSYFMNNNCLEKLPKINFNDSLLIGFQTTFGGSGIKERYLTYDSLTNIYTYSVTILKNDTSMLISDFNWILIPKFKIDSLNYNLIIQ